MGSSGSKPVRAAAGAAKRQYPKQTAPPPRTTAIPPKERKAPEAPTPQPPPPPPSQPPHPAPGGPTYHSQEQPSSTKSNAIDLDGRDPDFAASLRSIGPVNPHPTLSHSSTFKQASTQTVFPTASNPALLAVSARQRITEAAQEEMDRMARGEYTDRQFLDALTIQQVLNMRDLQRMPPKEIEKSLRLKEGTLRRFGREGVVARAG